MTDINTDLSPKFKQNQSERVYIWNMFFPQDGCWCLNHLLTLKDMFKINVGLFGGELVRDHFTYWQMPPV